MVSTYCFVGPRRLPLLLLPILDCVVALTVGEQLLHAGHRNACAPVVAADHPLAFNIMVPANHLTGSTAWTDPANIPVCKGDLVLQVFVRQLEEAEVVNVDFVCVTTMPAI